jgi:pimeloyl-ACP methyl ester carboxylesterase
VGPPRRSRRGDGRGGRELKRVVLLHSALGDSRLWERQVEALRPRFEVVAPDLPGYGTEPLPSEPFSFVDRVAALLPGLLVGNSFGGAVALQTALARPDLVERLVLIGSGFPGWSFGEAMTANWDEERAAIDAGDLDLATEVSMRFWVASEHRDFVRPQQRLALELQTAHAEPEVLWPEPRPLSSLPMPTLVVIGEHDQPDFHAIARHLADEIPNARLVEVADAGHLVGVERPEELNRLLLEFLA